jgi:hypothetical protein
METIGNIKVLIEELNQTAGNNDLARKLEIGEKLATYNWLLSDFESEVHAETNSLEFEYKSSVARDISRATGTDKAKEAAAKEKYEALNKVLVQKQNLLRRLTLLRQQTNVVIEQNRQTVATLKHEFRQSQ